MAATQRKPKAPKAPKAPREEKPDTRTGAARVVQDPTTPGGFHMEPVPTTSEG